MTDDRSREPAYAELERYVPEEEERPAKSRHERYAHPTPVLTCPACIWIVAARYINRRPR